MTQPFNPFHQWLGIDANSTNPHHFQLLGVDPRTSDEEQIQRAVDKGTKRCLALLEKVPAGEHDELRAKMKHRIAVARKTLSDPDLRQAYLRQLKQRVQAQRSGKLSALPRKQTQQSPDTNPPQPKQPQSSISADSPPDRMPTSVPDQTRSSQPGFATGGSQPVPMAIPLASPPQTTAQPIESGVAAISGAAPSDEVIIRKRLGRRRKKNILVPLAVVFMFVFMIVGSCLIYRNFDVLTNLAGDKGRSEENSNSSNDQPLGVPSSEKTTGPGQPKVSTISDLDIDNLPVLDEEEVMMHEQTLDATNRDRESMEQSVKQNAERLKNVETDDSIDGTPSPTPEPESRPQGSEEPSAAAEPTRTLVEFDDFQLSKIRRHLQRTWRSFYRHDLEASLTSIDYAHSVVAEVTSGISNVQFNKEHAPIVALVAESKTIHDLLLDFWGQVVASCQDIPGGQKIEASGQTMAFVEANAERVILRHQGANISYQFRYCPRAIAVSLAQQGAVPDVPVWNMQLAAYYAVDQIINRVDHGATINELLLESEEAGHDCTAIRNFAGFRFGSTGVPKTKIPMPNKNAIKELLAEFRSENQYKNPKQLNLSQSGSLSRLLLQIDSPNFEQHAALLEEARKIGIRSGDAAITVDAIVELDLFAQIDRANLICTSYLDLTDGELTTTQCRELMELAIPFLKSEMAKSAKLKSRKTLTRKLGGLAATHHMSDAMRRIAQIQN